MVRTVTNKYGVWLCGYYDDFLSAKTVGYDNNNPNNTTAGAYAHLSTHYGNPLNGEATLNPRYRWAMPERAQSSGAVYKFAPASLQYYHNKGMFEWLTHDSIRNYSDNWQGRAQLQFPDSHTNAQQYKLDASGSDAFHIFTNGHNTSDRYVVPLGDIDSSFGRETMRGLGYMTDYAAKTGGVSNWLADSGGNSGTDNDIAIVRRAHLTGRWMGERLKQDSGDTTYPLDIFAPLESPSGQPFLTIQTWHKAGSSSLPSTPTIYYQGSLNSRGTGDFLHFRIATRAFNGAGAVTPTINIKAGFPSTGIGATYEGGLQGTAAISFNLDLSSYSTLPLLYDGNNSKLSYTNNNSWIDVDVWIDYDNNKYQVYQDGVAVGSLTSFAISRAAKDMYGWAIHSVSPNGTADSNVSIMLDRASLYRPLTDSIKDNDFPGIYTFDFSSGVNATSTMKISVRDKPPETNSKGFSASDYKHQLTEIFKSEILNDWWMILFTGAGETGQEDIANIDRPTWRGLIDSIAVKENNQDRTISISAQDTFSLLTKQVLLWEVGQGKVNDSEGSSAYWAFEAEGMKDIMYLGASKLKQFAGNIGFESGNSYEPRDDQRTQLYSGHPIQMYNNEETYGPNSLEDDYEGMGIDYIIHDGTNQYIYLTGNPGYSSSDSITIRDTDNAAYDDKTVTIQSVSTVDGQQRLTITDGSGSGEMQFTDKKAADIVYAGKYIGESIGADNPEYSFDNGFATNDIEAISNWLRYFNLVLSHPKGFFLDSVSVINPGNGYNKQFNYYTLIDGENLHQGDLTISGGSPTDTALATWFSDGEEITHVEVREPGRGYGSVPTASHSGITGTGTELRGGIVTFTVKATGSNSLASIGSDVLSNAGSIIQEQSAFNVDGNRNAPKSAIFEVASPDGTLSASDITLQYAGSGYDPSGSGTAVNTNILIDRVGGSTYTLDITVNTIFADATFVCNLEGEPTTDFYTFLMKTDPELLPGEEFVIAGKAITGHTANELDKIEGKHTVKSVKKIFNYHDGSYSVGTQRFWYQVQTYTPYTSSSAEFGDWPTNNGLLANRIGWSKVTGGTVTPKPTSQTEDISNRAVHAKWMRDLPKSLWFQYHFGKIQYDSNPISTDLTVNGAISLSDTEIQIDSTTYAAIANHGLVEIERVKSAARYDLVTEIRDIFIYQCKYQIGSNYYIGGIKFISADHPTSAETWISTTETGSINTTLNFLTISSNYKHLWVLWADMRNDGNADADGLRRKTSFGLQYPSHKNYDVKLLFEDQFNDQGEYETYAELKQGEDVDVWEIDATNDPSTAGAFSHPIDYANAKAFAWTDVSNSGGTVNINHTNHGLTTNDKVALFNINDSSWDGVYNVVATADANNFRTSLTYPGIPSVVTMSNQNDDRFFFAKITGSYDDISTYQDWQNKAGAFVIVDASKFFNMNTLANDGSFTKTSGGKTDLGDYYAVREADPVLIDTYWKQAASTEMTTGDTYRKHENMDRLTTQVTDLADVKEGQFYLVPTDLTLFNENGIGRIIAHKDEEELKSEFYYTWNGKVSTKISGSFETVSVSTFDTHFVCTDNQGSFTSDLEGAYIKNTSKPLVAGVGDSWKTNFIQEYWYRIKTVVSTTVMHIERVSYLPINPFGSGGLFTAQPGENYNNYENGLNPNVLRAVDIADGWANTHNYQIVPQIYNVNLESATKVTTDTTYSQKVIEEEFAIKQSEYGRRTEPHCRVGILNANYTAVKIYNTVAAEYAFRLMMHLGGYVRNENIGTFAFHDKFRMLWNLSILDSWWTTTRLPTTFGLNTVPVTDKMTTYNDISTHDRYGSVYKADNKKLSEIIRGVQETAGTGSINGYVSTFSYMIGRDNKMEFRPKFNAGYEFTRNNINLTAMEIKNNGVISNVRVQYNDGNSFVDYPATSLGDITKWKIVQAPLVLSDKEAEAMARREYEKHKGNDIRIKMQPIRDTGQGDVMLDGGRFGYIQDAQIAYQGNADQSTETGWCWTKLGTGGVLFPGMVNALDGNLGSAVTSTTKNTRYGTSKIDATANTDRNVSANNNYYWYGSNSLAHAVQIVNVSKNANKTSSTTGEKLRVVLALKPNQTIVDIRNAQFNLYLLDCSFSTTASSGYAPHLKGIIKSHSVKTLQHSGFYEISLPSTYGTGTIVVSFNAEYCRDLMRSRCGDPSQTTHGSANYIFDNCVADIVSHTGGSSIELDTGNAVNDASIFPLGYRPYTELISGSMSTDGRLLWYAPSITIVDDLMYVPGSIVTYTDAGMDFNAENLVIQDIKWSANTTQGERVQLTVERDESRSMDGLLPYILADPGNMPVPLPPTVNTTVPPTTSDTGNITSEDQLPSGGNNPGTGTVGSFTTESAQSIDNFGRGLSRTIKGAMALGDSDLSAQSGFHILGQPKTSTTPSNMRGMTGPMRMPVVEGAAISNETSFELPGIGKEKQGQGEAPSPARDATHAVEIEINTPEDATTNEINITGVPLMNVGRDGGSTGVLHISVRCVQTGASASQSISISPAMNQNNVEMLPTSIIDGVTTPGNNLIIRVSRTPGQGNDTALYSSVSVSNFRVNFRRAGVSTASSQNSFIPYR